MPDETVRSGLLKIRGSEYEEVYTIYNEFLTAFRADEKNRERSYRNWQQYFAVDSSQWTDLARQRLNEQNRHTAQYNIIGPKVDALVGSMMQETFELDWKPIEGARNSLTEAIKASYYTDKEICDYDKNFEAVIRDAMIYQGVLKIQMSDRHNPLKNIAMHRVEPGFVIFDPPWLSDNDDECEKCWEIFHLSAEEIAEKYGVMSPRIDEQIKIERASGISYVENHLNPNNIVMLEQRGHLHRVIEYHYISKIKTTRVIGQRMDSQRWIPFPITKDKSKLEKYMIDNNIDPMTMQDSPYTDRIHKIKSIAPELINEKMLEKGVSVIQTTRLPYIQLTANRAFGQNKGIVDDLFDIQQTINKRESKLTDIIATATGGGKLVNKDMFDTPAKRERFRQKANDPGYIEFVDGDELGKERAIQYINSAQYPSQLIDQLNRMYEIVDRVSKVPAALEAISENANESGILFERKIQVARINTITIVNRIRDFYKKCAEGYFWQWQAAYNGPERTFSTSDGKYVAHLNRRVFNHKDGKVYIENRPDQIPRCHVICTESKSSPNKTIRDRAIYSELYNLSTQTNPEYASFFFELILNTMELDDEHKLRLKEISTLQQVRDRMRITTEMASLDATSAQSSLMGVQAKVGLQQIMAQMQQQQSEPQQIPESEIQSQGGAPEEFPIEEAPLTENELSDSEEPAMLSADRV